MKKTRLADYIISFLVDHGVCDIFLVSGGGISHLVDAVGQNTKIRYIANHHEQASTIAAESYSRVKGTVGVSLVTTGPGSTNAITGVADCWVESIPIMVISGQVRTEVMADYTKLRQLGPQEINIIDIVRPITKYAVTVLRPERIRYELEKAYYYATTGRSGPVWINVPLNIQSALIDESSLVRFFPPKKRVTWKKTLTKLVSKTITMIEKSKRPLLITGFGIRQAKATTLLTELINRLNMPIVLHINGLDLVPFRHPLLVGQYGPAGQRRANFALQNADLILGIGTSLNIGATGFNFADFGKNAKKIMVNVDKNEIEKKTLAIDLPIVADAGDYISELLKQTNGKKFLFDPRWYKACDFWKKTYPTIVPEFFFDTDHVNTYVFFDRLSNLLNSADYVTTGIGYDAVSYYHAFKVKKDQRSFNNENFGGMGWCLPGAIGACIGNHRHRHICVTGDGSIQFNIHELGVIAHNKLPIKLFVFNNSGYESIRSMQENLFDGRLVGADETSGLMNPNFGMLAKAYGIPHISMRNNGEIESKIKEALSMKGPVLCEVNVAKNQLRIPKSQTKKLSDGSFVSPKLEDLWPFLSDEEICKNMHMFED